MSERTTHCGVKVSLCVIKIMYPGEVASKLLFLSMTIEGAHGLKKESNERRSACS